MTIASVLFDTAVRHQINLLRLGNGVVRRLMAVLLRAERELALRLAEAAETGVREELILDTLRSQIRRTYEMLNTLGSRELRDLAEYEAEFTHNVLRGLDVNLDFHAPSPERIFAVAMQPQLGRTITEWFESLGRSTYERLRDIVRIGMLEGQTVNQIVSRMRGPSGAFAAERRNLEAVTRTLFTGISNTARDVVYEENTDLIKGVRWVSTLDSRTTPICQERDGNVYPVGKGPRPPAHVNCRSTTVPVLKSPSPVSTRAAAGGPVRGDMTYAEWLRTQSAEVQDDVLGKARGELFRKGKLTLDRFINDQGRYYTLEQLRRRESAAFRRAGI